MKMIDVDGTDNKGKLGASLALAAGLGASISGSSTVPAKPPVWAQPRLSQHCSRCCHTASRWWITNPAAAHRSSQCCLRFGTPGADVLRVLLAFSCFGPASSRAAVLSCMRDLPEHGPSCCCAACHGACQCRSFCITTVLSACCHHPNMLWVDGRRQRDPGRQPGGRKGRRCREGRAAVQAHRRPGRQHQAGEPATH